MPHKRKEILTTGEIYHVLNHSIASEEIFVRKNESNRSLELVDFYRFPQRIRYSQFKLLPKEKRSDYAVEFRKLKPLVEIYAFAFMPNHYHTLLKQIQEDGIKIFASNFQNGFAKYFNKKNNRQGALFLKSFKAKRITTDEQFLHVSRYIHLNPVTSYLIEFDQLGNYPWTSFHYYVRSCTKGNLVNTRFLLKMFGTREKYEKFVANQVDYQRKLHLIKNLILEQNLNKNPE